MTYVIVVFSILFQGLTLKHLVLRLMHTNEFRHRKKD
jgi:NhaP-type Na+/H+ or K+/H+ antiporter